MLHYVTAFRDFLRGFKGVFSETWKQRQLLDSPKRSAEELAFLPAHLELLETPVSPLPHWIARAIIALACIALIWSCVGKIDVVAVATGKIITSGRTRIIQPLEPSIVRKIYVSDGQHVTAGDSLIELDSTTAEAELKIYQDAWLTNALALARNELLLRMTLSDNPAEHKFEAGPLTLPQIKGANATQMSRENALLNAQYSDFINKITHQQLLIEQNKADLETLKSKAQKLNELLAISQKRSQDYLFLYQKKHLAKHEWLQQKQETVQYKNDLIIQEKELIRQRQVLKTNQQEINNIYSAFIEEHQEKIKELQDKNIQYTQEIKKYEKKKDILNLVAPVDGTVQQLAVHTVGGVVTEAQPLLAIVPDNEQLLVEAMILNKDIGFIVPGQQVVIKIESFPYTRYGYIDGEVVSISHDAIQDENQQLVFSAKISPRQSYIMANNARIPLTPGMVVSAEIKTDKRRIIDYFLSPLRQYAGESLRER